MSPPTNIRTKAYVVEKLGAPFVLRDVVLDEVRDDELLVEMKYTGLCHTDLVVQQGGMPVGSFPAVLGHEGVATVLHVGASVTNKALAPSDTVILSVHTCHSCRPCTDGRPGACLHATRTNFLTPRLGPAAQKSPIALPNGTPVHGQFFGQSSLSRRAVVAHRCVVRLPGVREADLQFLAPLACGYLTGAGTVFNVFKPTGADKVAVLGAGAVGFAAIMAAKTRGAGAVVAVDIVDAKLRTALELGATHAVNTSTNKDLNAAIREIFPDGVDKILDTTGVPSLLNSAFKALSHDGTLALVGVPPATADLQFNALDLLTSCKKVVGVIEGYADPQIVIPQLVQLYHEGKFPIDRLSKTYAAGDLEAALADLQSGQVIKPILSWEGV